MEHKVELLQRASSEIKHLRSQNQLMAAKLEMFDSMMMLLTAAPVYKSTGLLQPDIVYEMDKAIEAEKNKMSEKADSAIEGR